MQKQIVIFRGNVIRQKVNIGLIILIVKYMVGTYWDTGYLRPKKALSDFLV